MKLSYQLKPEQMLAYSFKQTVREMLAPIEIECYEAFK